MQRSTIKGLIASASLSILTAIVLTGCASNRSSNSSGVRTKKALVVTTTTGFRHSSIKTAERVLAKLAEDSRAFTIDYVRQPPNEPQEPRKPDEPKPPKPDSDPEKQKAEQDKYEKAKAKYEADLAKYEADEPKLRAEYKIARPLWEAKLKEALMPLAPASLKNYDIVIFANTTGDLPLPDRDGFIDWIRQGHAFVGTHSASDTFHGYRPYIEMLGGEFQTHGAQERVECIVADRRHPATKHFGPTYNIGGTNEEIYIIKSYNPATVHELLYLDKHPNTKQPGHYAVSWCKQFGKGKVFYTSLGHNEFVWQREDYQKHVLGGIKWALGLERGDAKPQAVATATGKSADGNGFRPLFNGKDLTGWHLRNPKGHNSWSIEKGAVLKNTVNPGEHGTDLVTDSNFWNFTVKYEFMVPDRSNSGFYLRGRHKLQIFGDYESGKPTKNGNGAIYNFKAPDVFASRPGGEWQTAEATIIGNKITVTLNGKKIHDNVECKVATGSEIDKSISEPGPIFLQGDHGTVSFRNIMIKELPFEAPPGKVKQL